MALADWFTALLKVRIIEVRPSKKLGGWIAFEAPGVEPAFTGPFGKQDAISFAASRFNGNTGEVRVYDEFGLTLLDTITIEGRGHYPQAGSEKPSCIAA